MPTFLPAVVYTPDLEQPEQDEAATIAELRDIFVGMARTAADHEGHAHRAVHAKGQGLLRATLSIAEGLPAELAQGLFATPAHYSAIMRFSSPPAEQLPDSVSTPRAVAIKVLGVPGERVQESEERASQDFLMVNGPVFTSPGPKGFLRASKLLASTTERMPRTKVAISKTLRGAEKLLEALGTDSGKLKGLGGEPQIHPLGEVFFTQVPFRYGPYVAKFSLRPASPALRALEKTPLDNEPDAQREAIRNFFATLQAPAEWDLCAQLCRDLARMPIEDASVEWPVTDSPFLPVARLAVARQDAWDASASPALEDRLAFSPWHALAAHRPLGALNRARKQVMAASREFRSQRNGCPLREPSLV